MQEFLVLAPEVADALATGGPLVALESSLIAQGLPHPQGVETAMAASAAVRAHGAVPATVAVLDGRIRVGLAVDDLTRLATAATMKCGARDLPFAITQAADAGTTVSATLRVAAQLGIRLFATGGIGGVHRQLASTPAAPPDVSADLPELARGQVAVVAAGAKSILDLPATLEWLETLGVPVIGFGTDSFPAFFAADSGLPVAQRLDDVADLAHLLQLHWALTGAGGVLVCQPPPAAAALSAAEVENLVAQALAQAAAEGITGQQVTPFLLAQMRALSNERTLAVNMALVEANADLAGRLAAALAADQP